uniref:Zinc finger protein ubi-d4 B n=1 Tax=Cacopsylla melanoneura TaxID=428564 RepID=A0A8D8R139_9HEMI
MAAADLENSLIIPRLESLESTLSEISYREAVKNASNFNARLTIDRKHRNPFLDSQTGIAHSPSTLYFNERQRLPGLRVGQIYSYPAKRWRKKRRQYLCNYNTVPIVQKKEESTSAVDAVVVPPTVAETPSVTNINEDSKDSIGIKDQESATSKDAWYYDEMEMHEMDCFDEPDPDSDFDYEESYSTKRKKKRSMAGSGGSRSRSSFGGGDSPNRRSGSRSSVAGSGAGVSGTPLQSSSNKSPSNANRGGRRKTTTMAFVDLTDADKPFACDLCGARYKTRPGLTYHYTHSHKEGSCADVVPPPRRGGDRSGGSGGGGPSSMDEDNSSSQDDGGPMGSPGKKEKAESGGEGGSSGWRKFQDSYVTFLNSPGAPTPGKKGSGGSAAPGGSGKSPTGAPALTTPTSGPSSPSAESKSGPETSESSPAPSKPPATPSAAAPDEPALPVLKMEQNEKARAKPSPYCDFCLGDTTNKKSGQPEDLVSCSDCGRSGHPTCLQFTNNMKVSVKQYRWQCIECKCCSVCGTSDNDDQLLFCDDCDRGYHMYCLVPPIHTPPEGSWSCQLCIKEFHKK